MSPEESKQAVLDVLDSTIELIGTSGWSEYNDPGIRDFELSDGAAGVNFVSNSTGAGGDAASTVATVEAHWKTLGMTSRVVEGANPADTRIHLLSDAGESIESENPDHLPQ